MRVVGGKNVIARLEEPWQSSFLSDRAAERRAKKNLPKSFALGEVDCVARRRGLTAQQSVGMEGGTTLPVEVVRRVGRVGRVG